MLRLVLLILIQDNNKNNKNTNKLFLKTFNKVEGL